MMLYSIKDNKGNFSAIITFNNDEVAKRNLVFLLDQDALYKRYPEDFSLFRTGSFDFESGIITAENTPVYICSLADVVGGND